MLRLPAALAGGPAEALLAVRYPRLWVIAGWSMLAVIVWLSVTPSPPDPGFEQGDKLEHLVAYGALMFWFCQLYTSRRAQVGLAIGFIALGVGLEFVQGALEYRTYDEMDMVANTLGVVLGWGVARAAGAHVFARIERIFRG